VRRAASRTIDYLAPGVEATAPGKRGVDHSAEPDRIAETSGLLGLLEERVKGWRLR
jgi:hypothetical protein